jgi:eukaryotic-like serine/threonine-protein kinase
MSGIVLTILGGLGCLLMMGVVMLAMARLMRPNSRVGAIIGERVLRPFRRTRFGRKLGSSIDALARAVQIERPDLREATAPDGTVTILFTDVVDSTAATERLGDQRWLELMREHNRIVRDQVQALAGYEVKSQGDGFMIAFSSARSALLCATAIQQAFAAHSEREPRDAIELRIGVHTGEALREEGDFHGRNVILAARIADEAKGGEILASSLVQALAESSGDIEFGTARTLHLKGLRGSHTVVPVRWQDEARQRATVTSLPTTMARRTAG